MRKVRLTYHWSFLAILLSIPVLFSACGGGSGNSGGDVGPPPGVAGNPISAGGFHSMALKTDGSLWAWGYNGSGQLGIGTSGPATNQDVPVLVPTDNNWVSVSAGYTHTVALKKNGSLWAWGSNESGQLGIGTSGPGTEVSSPALIPTDNNWAFVSAGRDYTVALKKNGTLWAWGKNDLGQLGIGPSGAQKNPVQVTGSSGTSDWASVSAGNTHTMALKANGTLWGWGDNGNGKIGDGTTTQRTSPVQVSGAATNWASVSAGNSFTIALKKDGTLWVWGYNGSYQLGISSLFPNGTTTPEQLTSPLPNNNWSSISAGGSYTVAMRTNGDLFAWGDNFYGQLGVGDNVTKTAPMAVPTAGTGFKYISAGDGHTMGVKTNDTLWSWGDNFFGQLGEPTAGTESFDPVPVTF